MPGLERRPVWLPSYALRETSEVALRNPEKLFFFLISKLLLVESGWEGSWGGHFVHSPLSGQMYQVLEKLSEQGLVGNQPRGAGLGRAIFKGLWRPGTVLLREQTSRVLFLRSSYLGLG